MLRTRTAIGLSAIVLVPGLFSARWATPAPGDDGSSTRVRASATAAQASPRAGVRSDTLPVPTDPHELRAWLGRGTFTTWPHQAAPHAADSPHGDQAQVYLNPALAESVHARKPTHHQGAAAVLVMSDENGLPWGWAVAVKAHASSNHGQGWYWYQVKSGPTSGRTDFDGHMIPEDPDEAGLGVPECLSCHVKGHDYIITRSLD
jgi:hypothetical protein